MAEHLPCICKAWVRVTAVQNIKIKLKTHQLCGMSGPDLNLYITHFDHINEAFFLLFSWLVYLLKQPSFNLILLLQTVGVLAWPTDRRVEADLLRPCPQSYSRPSPGGLILRILEADVRLQVQNYTPFVFVFFFKISTQQWQQHLFLIHNIGFSGFCWFFCLLIFATKAEQLVRPVVTEL